MGRGRLVVIVAGVVTLIAAVLVVQLQLDQDKQRDQGDEPGGAPTMSASASGGEVTVTFPDGEVLRGIASSELGEGAAKVTVDSVAAGDGTIQLTVTGPGSKVSMSFEARPDERFYGLGERADAVEHRGREVENRVLDGPWPANQAQVVQSFVPPPGFSDRPDATYFPMPWVLSSRGHGVLVDHDESSRFRFATAAEDSWSVEVDSSTLDLLIFAGPAPADALGRMSEVIGRQPPPSAPFVMGPWWQAGASEGQQDELSELAVLRAADVPTSLVQTYTHYLPCGDDRDRREAERARVAALHDAGVAVTTYVNPMVCVSYEPLYSEGAAAGAFTLAANGEPARYHYSTATNFEVSQIDFSSDAGRALFADVLDTIVEDGHDGWMEDFGEYTPLDAVSADGTPGPTMHNRYVEQYHDTAREYAEGATRPLVRFNRSGWTGAVASSAVVWGGDPTVAWDFDGLRSAVRSGLGMGLSGVSLWGSDIGGFFAFPGDELSAELLSRWIELGAFSGVMRLQAGGISVGGGPRATVLDPEVLPVWERYARLRTQLFPYIAGAQEGYARTGMPLMRHAVLTSPDDEVAIGLDDQYLFGADLHVAPVLTEGSVTRSVHLPAGEWIDLWRSMSFDDGPRLGAATIRPGGGPAEVAATVDEIPLHVRAGAVVPLLPDDVDTLAAYGDDVVDLDDRADRRILLAFPGPTWAGPLGPGERMRSRTSPERWTLDIEADRSRTYELQASLALLDPGFVPCTLRVDGSAIEFDHDPRTRVLAADLPAEADSEVTVEACDPSS
ncbi:MAG TPA: TIM-barrel domain-containing protein [Microthrixaceae bacterium]|nr:TIM-barrel domain-containing protein [Microthrixaceae bacterium]